MYLLPAIFLKYVIFVDSTSSIMYPVIISFAGNKYLVNDFLIFFCLSLLDILYLINSNIDSPLTLSYNFNKIVFLLISNNFLYHKK